MPENSDPFGYVPDFHSGTLDADSPFGYLEEDDILPFGLPDSFAVQDYILQEEPEEIEYAPFTEKVVTHPDVGFFEGITKSAYNESLTRVANDILQRSAGILSEDESTSFDLSAYDPTNIEKIMSVMLSFLMPVDLGVAFIPGGVAAKGVSAINKGRAAGKVAFNAAVKSGLPPRLAEQSILKGGSRLLHNMARYGTGDASYGFVRSVANQYDDGVDFNDIDYTEALKTGAKDFAIGSTLGATETLMTGIRSRIGEIGGKSSHDKRRYFAKEQNRAYRYLPKIWNSNIKTQKMLTGQIVQKTLETSALSVMSPLLHEDRMPEMEDWVKTAGFVFGFPAAMKTPGKIAQIAKRSIPESQAVHDTMVQLKDRMNVGDFRVVEAIGKRIKEANLGAKAGRERVGKGFVEYPVQVGNRVTVAGRHQMQGQVGLVTDIRRTGGNRDYATVSFPTGLKKISVNSLVKEGGLTGALREAAGMQTKVQVVDNIIDMADKMDLSHPQLLDLMYRVSGKTPENLFAKIADPNAQDITRKLDKRNYLKTEFGYSELYRLQQAVKYGSKLTDSYLKKFEHLESSLSPEAQASIYADPQVPGGGTTAKFLRSVKDNWITPISEVIGKMGKPGKVIAQFMMDVDFQKDKYKAIALGEFEQVLKLLDEGDYSYKTLKGGRNYDIILAALEPEMYGNVIAKWEKRTGKTFDKNDPLIKGAVEAWGNLTKRVGKDIISENILVKDPKTGKRRAFGEDDLLDVYFRRIITPEFRELLYNNYEGTMNQIAEQLVVGSGDESLITRFSALKDKASKKGGPDKVAFEKEVADIFKSWQSFTEFQEHHFNYSAVDKFRKIKLKNNVINIDGVEHKVFRDDFANVARIWIEQSANYKFGVRAYGQDLEKAGLMLAALKNATNSPADVEFAKRAIEYQLGIGKPITEIAHHKLAETASRGITGFVAWTALSGPPSGLKNLVTGGSANIGSYGVLNSAHGIIDMLMYNPSGKTLTELFSERGFKALNIRKNLKDSYELARRSGALLSGQRSLELSQLAGGTLKKWNPGMMYPTELFNRMSSVFVSRRAYQESIKRLAGEFQYNKIWTETRAQGLLEDYFKLTPQQIKKAVKRYKTWGSYDNQLMERASYHGQVKTQGSTSVPHMPAWVQKHENIARPTTIFQRMAYRALYNIRDGMLKPLMQGNPLPLVRYSVATGLGGKALYEFSKFLVGESGGIKAETEKGNMEKSIEYFFKGEGLAILTGAFQDEGLSFAVKPATYKFLKDGVVAAIAATRGRDVAWEQAISKNFDNVAFWRILNRAREQLKAKDIDYVTQALGMPDIKLIPTRGKTTEGMQLKEATKIARNMQYHFADKSGYTRADKGKQSAVDWIEGRSPFYKDLKTKVHEGDKKDIARAFDATFMMIQAEEENNGVKTSIARKTALTRLKTVMKGFQPITLARDSYGRQMSKYREFKSSLSQEGKLKVKNAEDLWEERKKYINKALLEHSTIYNRGIFDMRLI